MFIIDASCVHMHGHALAKCCSIMIHMSIRSGKNCNLQSPQLLCHAAAQAKDGGILVMVVDVVMGRVLHLMHHSGACGPVAAALYDNQAVVQFWDARAFRWHLAVMELYEHAVQLPSAWKMITGAILPAVTELGRGHAFHNRLFHGHAPDSLPPIDHTRNMKNKGHHENKAKHNYLGMNVSFWC
jgi:hypothetical protein